MNSLSRRSLIVGSLDVGFALPALAQVPQGCGEQPKTAPAPIKGQKDPVVPTKTTKGKPGGAK